MLSRRPMMMILMPDSTRFCLACRMAYASRAYFRSPHLPLFGHTYYTITFLDKRATPACHAGSCRFALFSSVVLLTWRMLRLRHADILCATSIDTLFIAADFFKISFEIFFASKSTILRALGKRAIRAMRAMEISLRGDRHILRQISAANTHVVCFDVARLLLFLLRWRYRGTALLSMRAP